jgi:hypothetical protein
MNIEDLRQYRDAEASQNGGHLGLLGDGYDQMEFLAKFRWHSIPAWGRDGWDLGEWPYVIVYIRNNKDGVHQMKVVTEGDEDQYNFPDEATRTEAIDAWALWWWEHKQPSWFATVDRRLLKGPYNAAQRFAETSTTSSEEHNAS